MTDCRRLVEFQAWSHAGCDADLPLELRLHASQCLTCRQFVEDVELVRSAVEQAPIHQLSSSRLDSIEAVLQAELVRGPEVPRSHRNRHWLPRAAIVGSCVLLGAGAMAAVHGTHSRIPTATAEAVPVASSKVLVSRIGTARGALKGSQLTDPFQLDDGVVEFEVQRGTHDPPFRVAAGNHTIEAKVARFRVEVSAGEVDRIEVAAGEAKAQRGGGNWTTLVTGASYQPAVAPQAAADSELSKSVSPPPAAASGKVTRVPTDQAFAYAYGLYQSGQLASAAKAFDRLHQGGGLDPAGHCDALFWAAQAYARGGNSSFAESRARSLLAICPKGLRAGDAALLLGEYAEGRQNRAAARRYYGMALNAAQPNTRNRARAAIQRLVDD